MMMSVTLTPSGRQWCAQCPTCDIRLNWLVGETPRGDVDAVAARHNAFFHRS